MLFCGIDLHSNNCLVVVSDDNDKVVDYKRLPNDLQPFAQRSVRIRKSYSAQS
jgi:hypothetical protein